MKKRSTGLKLVLMSSATLALTGCGDPNVSGKPYKNLAACKADSTFTDAQCEETWRVVTEKDHNTAPRYDSRWLCEDQHGAANCSPRSGFWTPYMYGYFVPSVVDSVFYPNRARSLYERRLGGGYYTANGYRLSVRGSRGYDLAARAVKAPPKLAKVQTRTTIAARGGFGKSFGSRSFGG